MAKRFPAQARVSRTRCSVAVVAALGSLLAGASARAARPGTVLPGDTIPVLRGVVSDYHASATFSTATMPRGSGQSLTITQLLPRIILDWNKFDIGNGSKVQFIQPCPASTATCTPTTPTNAAVLNRIYDANPSTIQGQIIANGQVYLVNQNGILFDRGTQIDVNTLVASSLNISNDRFMGSLAEVGTNIKPAFTGRYDSAGNTIADTVTGTASTSKIQIGLGGPATAAAPRINAAVGGAIVIISPVIDNLGGVITSPDGQVILAAGRSVYLSFGASADNSMRGMLVEVTAGQEPVDLTSLISNSGTVSADRGNVSLAGLAINQSGRVLGVVGDACQWIHLSAGAHAQQRTARAGQSGGRQRHRNAAGSHRHDDAAPDRRLRAVQVAGQRRCSADHRLRAHHLAERQGHADGDESR